MFLHKFVSTLHVLLGKKNWLALAAFPLLGLLFVAFLAYDTDGRISAARAEAEASILQQAKTAVNSYEQQLTHTIAQVDQITLRLKYQWEDVDERVNLEKEHAAGLFPANQLLYASIFDGRGDTASSTVIHRKATNVRDTEYFQFHKANCCGGLLITHASPSRFMGRTVVRFTRRLDTPGGKFDGVASVAVEPAFLTTFQESPLPGARDFISVRLTSGPLLASRVGNENGEIPVFYKQDPVFLTASGVTLEPADKFRDNQSRFVAWKKLQNYPLVALAGFSATSALAPVEERAANLRKTLILRALATLTASLAAAILMFAWLRRNRRTEETQETYRVATDAANEAFYMIRPLYNRTGEMTDFRIEDCNNRAAEFVGLVRTHLVGLKGSELSLEHFTRDILALSRLALEKGLVEEEMRVPRESPIKAKWIYRRVAQSRIGLALTIRDISEAKAQEQALSELALSDMLTKLPNRHWLTDFLPRAVKQAERRGGRLAVLFIDLDNFKNINDTLGHEAGDELLVQASARLKGAVRASDHVARLGGDEFVVVLEQIHVEEDIAKVANGIVQEIGKDFELTAGTGSLVNASIGISIYPQDGQDTETLLKHADIAMYAAKAAGKGRFAFYRTHLSDTLILRLNKERALREAVELNQFVVHYQPRVGIHSGRLTSIEALVRWERPGFGLVYPSEFIGMAEDMGLIVQIGEHVIERVCAQLAQWQEHDLQVVPVSVNVSPQQLKSGKLSAFLAGCIERYGIAPRLIEAELTESAVIDRNRVVSSELAALRKMGIKLMIDDFGTGYSSMAQLHRLDVDVLKVDQAFTRELTEGSDATMLFRAIMSMADALDICVVAEGVETIDQVHILHDLACDEIQGHLISKAVTAAEMAQLMVKRILLATSFGTPRLKPA